MAAQYVCLRSAVSLRFHRFLVTAEPCSFAFSLPGVLVFKVFGCFWLFSLHFEPVPGVLALGSGALISGEDGAVRCSGGGRNGCLGPIAQRRAAVLLTLQRVA